MKSERARTERNFQHFVDASIRESFQSKIFDAKHVPALADEHPPVGLMKLWCMPDSKVNGRKSQSPAPENNQLAGGMMRGR
jgi:hypothetical protein